MTTNEHLVGFIITAVVTGVIVFGAVTLVYVLEKRRVDPPTTFDGPASRPDVPGGDQSTGDPAETFAPLGASLAAASQLRARAEGDPASTTRSNESATTNPGENNHAHQ